MAGKRVRMKSEELRGFVLGGAKPGLAHLTFFVWSCRSSWMCDACGTDEVRPNDLEG